MQKGEAQLEKIQTLAVVKWRIGVCEHTGSVWCFFWGGGGLLYFTYPGIGWRTREFASGSASLPLVGEITRLYMLLGGKYVTYFRYARSLMSE